MALEAAVRFTRQHTETDTDEGSWLAVLWTAVAIFWGNVSVYGVLHISGEYCDWTKILAYHSGEVANATMFINRRRSEPKGTPGILETPSAQGLYP